MGRYKIGLIVPSSNTTMETEIPELLRRSANERVTITSHSSRVRLGHVNPQELKEMIAGSDRCVVELADAEVDVIAYGCLVAVIAQGDGFHREAESHLAAVADGAIPVVSSAGALIRSLDAVGARRIALLAPYMKPLTDRVIEYLGAEGIEVVDSISLEIPKNADVARHDPMRLLPLAKQLDIQRADAVVLSACVQMPSLPAIELAEQTLDVPVISAATATVFELLSECGLRTTVPGGGYLLSDEVSASGALSSSKVTQY